MDARTGFSIVLLVVLTVLAALIVRPFVSYVLAAMLLAFVLTPVQQRLEERIGRRPAAFALVGASVVLVVLPIAAVLNVLADEVPTETRVRELFSPTVETIERTFGVEVGFNRLAARWLDAGVDAVTGQTSELLASGLEAFLGVLLLLFLVYYLLVDREHLQEWVRRVTPLSTRVQDELYDAAEITTWAVLKGHVLVAIAQGSIAGLGLFGAGIPNAAFWTVVMMGLAIVPIIGVSPVLGGAALYLFLQGRPIAAGLLVVWGITVVAITDDYLRAYVVDRESSLHSGVVLLGVFGATYLFGAVGLFIGPILLGLYVATIEVLVEEYGLVRHDESGPAG